MNAIEGLQVIGDPLFLIAFQPDDPTIDIYLVNDALKARGWRLNALQLPPALHFCVTNPNTAPGWWTLSWPTLPTPSIMRASTAGNPRPPGDVRIQGRYACRKRHHQHDHGRGP